MYRLLRCDESGARRSWRDFLLNKLLKNGTNKRFDFRALYAACISGALLLATLERSVAGTNGRIAVLIVSLAQVVDFFAVRIVSVVGVQCRDDDWSARRLSRSS